MPRFLAPTLTAIMALCLLTCSGSSVSVCGSQDGVCLALQVTGPLTGLDQLAVTLDQPVRKTLSTPQPAQLFTLPVQVALILPSQPTTNLKISVDALSAGQVVGHGETTVTVPIAFGALATVDLGAPTGPTDITLTGADPTTIAELDALNLSFAATDPSGGAVTLSATGVPAGANFVASGQSATLTWTPTISDAGVYQITITAKSADGQRTVTKMFALTVLNYADPLLDPTTLGPLGAVPIGDFDGDGFGDLALCAGPALGGTTNYSVRIIYGDATGLPTQGPFPAGRTKLYTVAIPAGTTSGGEYNCAGGDFDGDGKADIFLSDPFNSNRAKNQNGLMVVMYGVPRVVDTLASVTLLDATPTDAENIARYPVVGDYNGDKKADVIGVTRQGVDTYVLWLGQSARTNPAPIAYTWPQGTWCAQPGLPQAFGDVTGDGLDDILVADANVGYPGGMTCTGGVASNYGGFRILVGKSVPQLSMSLEYQHPTNPIPTSPAFSFSWGSPSTLCDLNSDGTADAIVLDTVARIWYGSAMGLTATSPLDVSQMTPLVAAAGRFAQPLCARSFFGAQSLVLANPTAPAGGRLDVVPASTGTPKVTMSLPNPDPSDASFGSVMAKQTTDVNGDGKQDLVVYSASKRWVIYGR